MIVASKCMRVRLDMRMEDCIYGTYNARTCCCMDGCISVWKGGLVGWLFWA